MIKLKDKLNYLILIYRIIRIGFPDSTCLITEPLNQYFNTTCKDESACAELNGEWIAMPDSGMTPFIGMIDTSITGLLPVLKMGGSQISINGNPFVQVQIDTFGTYGAFVTMDTTLMSDSLDVETIVCQPRIFSPGGSGSVFEFTETNIIYSLAETNYYEEFLGIVLPFLTKLLLKVLSLLLELLREHLVTMYEQAT